MKPENTNYNVCSKCHRDLTKTGDLRCRCRVHTICIADGNLIHNDIEHFTWKLFIDRLVVCVVPAISDGELIWRVYIGGGVYNDFAVMEHAFIAAIQLLTTAPAEQFGLKFGGGR